jgi:hypothetical protein
MTNCVVEAVAVAVVAVAAEAAVVVALVVPFPAPISLEVAHTQGVAIAQEVDHDPVLALEVVLQIVERCLYYYNHHLNLYIHHNKQGRSRKHSGVSTDRGGNSKRDSRSYSSGSSSYSRYQQYLC